MPGYSACDLRGERDTEGCEAVNYNLCWYLAIQFTWLTFLADLSEKFPNLTMESCESLGLMHQRGRQIPPPATPNPGSTSIQVRAVLPGLYEPSRLVLPLTAFGGEAAMATCVLVCHAVMGLSTYTQMATYKLVQAKSQDVGLSLLPDWLSHESRL